MKQNTEEAIALCIEALNNKGSGNDLRVLQIIRETGMLPYTGRGLGVGSFGFEDFRHSWENIYSWFREQKNIDHSLDWLNAFLLLCDLANYSEDEILASAQTINDNIIFNHVVKHIITNFAVRGEIEKGITYIPHFRKTVIFKEEDNLDFGYLIVLKYYALKGDSENFFRHFKSAKPAQNKTETGDLKGLLVARFAARNEIQASIDLCRHKNLGEKFYSNALYAFAEQGKYRELKDIFEKYPELKHAQPETELATLVRAGLKAKEKNLAFDDEFETLFERALNVDRKIRAGDVKLQDALLLELGLTNRDHKERVARCRKAIKNNGLKKEL